MPRAARVLIVGAIASRAAETAQALSARGYTVVQSNPEEAVAELLASRRPDVVLFERRGTQEQSRSAQALDQFADAVRDTALWQKLPFLMLEDDAGPAPGGDGLLLVDRLMNGPTDAEIDHRVSALARLGTMRNELSRRVRSANRLGLAVDVSVPTPGFVDNPHVLVAGVGLGLPKIQAALGDNATVFGVPTANLALDHLENFSVDLVCIDATTRIGRSLDMISALRRMPRWCAIPIVVTVPPDTDAATCKLMHDYGATDLIGLEESDDFAANRITVLIREHRYATAIQKSFVEMGTRIKDPGTNLIGREFGLVHLMELIHDSDRHGDGLSAVGIQIHADGAAASFAKSVSGALSSTVRGEDLAVSLSPDLFLIMLPGTDAPQARVIRDRISAIIGSTDFGVDDIGLPRIAPVSYATTTYKSGDTPEIFISRLLEGFAVAERPVDRIAVQEEKARS